MVVTTTQRVTEPCRLFTQTTANGRDIPLLPLIVSLDSRPSPLRHERRARPPRPPTMTRRLAVTSLMEPRTHSAPHRRHLSIRHSTDCIFKPDPIVLRRPHVPHVIKINDERTQFTDSALLSPFGIQSKSSPLEVTEDAADQQRRTLII